MLKDELRDDSKSSVLIVDDESLYVKFLCDLFKKYERDFEVLVALSGKNALDVIKNNEIDLVLLDINMPDMSGYDVCKRMKENLKSSNIPVIFITSNSDENSLVEGFMFGGVDYITKPFNPRELIVRVDKQLENRHLIKKLESYAFYDSLTKIYNRRKFFEKSEECFNRIEDSLFITMIDIDNFKSINDTFGHNEGDEVLKDFVNTVKTFLNEDYIFGRLGGEEFAIVCRDKNFEDFYKLMENIRETISKIDILTKESKYINFTISMGIAQYKDESKIYDILRKADEYLYIAKNEGKNRIAHFIEEKF